MATSLHTTGTELKPSHTNPSRSGGAAAAILRPLRAIASERGQLTAFVIVWTTIVVLPMLGVVLFSFLLGRGMRVQWAFTLKAYQEIIETGRLVVVERTLLMAGAVTLTCLLIGFPFAFWLAKRVHSRLLQEAIWMALTVPFFLDPSARTLVWRAILGSGGVVNLALRKSGLASAPVEWLLFSPFSVFFGLVGPYFPNMVWPVYLAVVLIPEDVLEAARDLGAGPGAVMRDVVIPLALPGIVAGIIFTFVPVLGDTIAPTLLGGSQEYLGMSISSLVRSLNFAGAAAFATLILGLTALLILAAGVATRAFRGQGETS